MRLKGDKTFRARSSMNFVGHSIKLDLSLVAQSPELRRHLHIQPSSAALGVARPHPAKYPNAGGRGISVSSGSSCRRLISISAVGTFRTWRDVRLDSATRVKANTGPHSTTNNGWPKRAMAHLAASCSFDVRPVCANRNHLSARPS